MSSTTQSQEITEITPDSEFWPQGLRDLSCTNMNDPMPERLWVRGSLQALQHPAIGIVGARAATGYGKQITWTFAEDIVRSGYAVVSGLAYGIDGAAHRAALAIGGITIAYVPHGIDHVYPVGHAQLAEEIISSGGAIISKYPPKTQPSKAGFLERSSLLAAHVRQLIVVEAGFRSGSLSAVEQAYQLGRPVWAVPGPLTSAASAGCNRIIQNGSARLLVDVEDLDLLTPES